MCKIENEHNGITKEATRARQNDKKFVVATTQGAIAAVSRNRLINHLPDNAHTDCIFVHHQFINKLPARIQEKHAWCKFNKCTIVTKCDKAWTSLFAIILTKWARSSVNLVKDTSEEGEVEPICDVFNFVDGNQRPVWTQGSQGRQWLFGPSPGRGGGFCYNQR